MSFLIIILGGLVNTFFRGGFIENWFPKFKHGKIINSALFGLTSYLVSQNIWFAICMMIAMSIGQAPAIFSKLSDVAQANRDAVLWNMVVFERGFIWTVPIVGVAVWFYGLSGLVFCTGLLMPIAYIQAYRNINYKYTWPICEFIYGCMLWFGLYIITLS